MAEVHLVWESPCCGIATVVVARGQKAVQTKKSHDTLSKLAHINEDDFMNVAFQSIAAPDSYHT